MSWRWPVLALVCQAAGYSPWDPDANHKAQAIAFDEDGDIAGAILSFRQAAIFAPTVSQNWNNLGIALVDEENPGAGPGADAEASVAFNRAVRVDPTNQWAKENLAAVNRVLLKTGALGALSGSIAAAKASGTAQVTVNSEGGTGTGDAEVTFPFPSSLLRRFHASVADPAGGAGSRGHVEPLSALFPALLPAADENWPFVAAHFERADEDDDALFYAQPRFVTHIDDGAIGALTRFYAKRFAAAQAETSKRLDILELCASWISHLPSASAGDGGQAVKALGRVAGIGMNQAELDKNTVLTERVVQDLNLVPKLPFMDESFDFVLCVVSIDYLVKPRAVLRDALRVLRPGGQAIISFSNRFFPPKVIRLWRSLNSAGRAWIVGAYLHHAGFAEVEVSDVSPNEDGDPMVVVTARKA